MHWLTWQQFIEFLKTWQGAAATAFTVIAALYYGPRKMLETWDWYWERFRDNAVLLAMYPRRFVRSGGVAGHSGQTKELPYEVKQIAEQLKRKETSVLRSLHRLLRRGKVERHENGWRAK